MSNFTIHNGDNGENKMILFPEFQKDRLIGLFLYFEDDNNPGSDIEYEFSFSYADSVLLRNYLSGMIDMYEKKGTVGE